jgi:hypothetical protein
MTQVFVGIDPALRHTGYCIRKGKKISFFETKTKKLDFLSATTLIKRDFLKLTKTLPKETIFCLERQFTQGSFSASQFYIQMIILDLIRQFSAPDNPRLVYPAPVQLKSYMAKKQEVDITSKSTIIASFQQRFHYSKRISSHCVEGFYLTLLGEDVLNQSWSYSYNDKKAKPFSWDVMTGSEQ